MQRAPLKEEEVSLRLGDIALFPRANLLVIVLEPHFPALALVQVDGLSAQPERRVVSGAGWGPVSRVHVKAV